MHQACCTLHSNAVHTLLAFRLLPNSRLYNRGLIAWDIMSEAGACVSIMYVFAV